MAFFSKSTLDHVALGQKGNYFINGSHTSIHTGNFIKIQVITDCIFSELIPVNNEFIGTDDGEGTDDENPNRSGDAVDNTFPAGMTILGHWTGIQLASGSVIAYQG